MASIEQLYKAFGVLADAKDKAGEHEAEYRLFMEAVKGNPGEKRLASQFMTRFFKHFPGLARETINALFDLCEDADVMIRKQAIKDLPSLCRICPQHTAQIAEALSQLLLSDDATELSVIQSSLVSLFTINAKGVLEGMFQYILAEHEDDDNLREKVLKFLTQKLKTLPDDTVDKDAEDFVVAQCKKVLLDVTKDEFLAVMDILRSLKTMSTVQGRQQLVEIVTEQAELDQPLEATDADCVDRLLQCMRTAAPLFSKNVHSKAFATYVCEQAMPVLDKLASPDPDTNVQLDLLKLFAELSEHAGDLDNQEACVEKVYNRLLEYMPLPPENEELSSTEEPKLKFSFVECLMFAFHQMARRCSPFLSDEANAERLKDFKLRLQYFARGVQVYIKQLRAALQGKSGDALRTDENKIKVVALKITSNINTLIKDLFHSPPAYKATITLSWKPVASKATAASGSTAQAATGEKRITPITYSSNGASAAKKAHKDDRQLYAPPSGKFSEKAGTFNRGGGRGGNRGAFRGRRGRNFRRY
ncbi:apoptosis inhibitor 5-like [Littorina saxatilis]|uniref:Apoptosis inhibitor 5 n=1 Tax=Littorina saxatilis TaxID=31220 RepID=A0AAN9B4D6_9CAEN